MKVFIILTLCLILTGCTQLQPIQPSPVPSPTLATVTYNQQTYSYALVQVPDLSRLQLLANHDQKTSSGDLVKQHHCQILVNGNFYDEADKPLGWLVSNGKVLSLPIISRLFNGYLFFDGQTISISQFRPEAEVRFGLQSGPLLILDSRPLKLTINQDESRRRIIAAITPDQRLYFLALTSSYLAETPALVQLISREINQPFLAAINLDGGSASAFYTPQQQLQEYSYIGSFFCYTD